MKQRLPNISLAMLMITCSGCLFFSPSSRTSYFRPSTRLPLLTPWNRPADLFSSENDADLNEHVEEYSSDSATQMELESSPIEAGLEMTIEAPRQRQVGSLAGFQLTLRNKESETMTDVVVEATFDSLLQFPGSDEKTVRRALGAIPPDASKTFSLHLTGTQTGRGCCRFSISSHEEEMAWKSVCVEIVPRRINLTLSGPEQGSLGVRLEYVLHAENLSEQTLSRLELNVRFPNQLHPVDGTRDVRINPGKLIWYPESLPAGESLEHRVIFECRGLADQACITAELLENDLSLENAQSCVKILRDWRKTRQPTASRRGKSPSLNLIRLDHSPGVR